jgi:hypothetical protein
VTTDKTVIVMDSVGPGMRVTEDHGLKAPLCSLDDSIKLMVLQRSCADRALCGKMGRAAWTGAERHLEIYEQVLGVVSLEA